MTVYEKNYISTTVHEQTNFSDAQQHFVLKKPQEPDPIDTEVLLSTDYNGLTNLAADWISAHKANQAHIENVAKRVKFIKFDEFSEKLVHSYKNVTDQLQEEYGNTFNCKDHVVVLVEGCKSNKWVAELVRDKCEAEPLAYLRLGDKQAKEVDAYFQNLSPQALQRAIAYLKDKTFMLFDDGSYSGTQLQEHISHLLEIIKTHQIKIKAIAVVVPFMTRHAELTLRAIPHQDTQVIISKHETIDTLDEIQEADTRQFLIRAWFKNDTEILKKMGLIWLEHKVPNDQSFPAPLASGSIYDETGNPSKKCIGIIPQIIPPYKKSEKLKNTQNIHRVYSWLFRGGKPNDLEVLLKEQISHVINLQEKQDLHFSADLKKENIEEKHIPFDIEKPNDDLVSEYLSFLCFTQKNIKNPKFYIHCFHGSDRTGMLVAITKVFYKIQSLKGTETDKDLEDTKSEAIKEMLDEKYGFHKISNNHLIEYVSNLNVGNLKDQVVEKIKKLTQAKQTDYFDQEQLKMKKAVNFNYAVKPKD